MATGSHVKKASWGKNKGKKGKRGKKKVTSNTAGVVPGCEKNRTESGTPESKVEQKVEGHVDMDDIEVDLSGEKVLVVDDVTDLKGQGENRKKEGKMEGGEKACPFSKTPKDRLKGQEPVESADEKPGPEKVLPPGHPPVDVAGFSDPAKPMLDLRMFCPKFAGEGEAGGDPHKDTYDDLGKPIDMDEFVRGFQEFLNKKKALEKKINRVDSDSDEESP